MPDSEGSAAEQQPIQTFGGFFKNYALGASVVVAALPLAAVKFDTIPQFESMKPLLALLGSGSSFLLVGVIFAQRHAIARRFFPTWRRGDEAVVPSAELRAARLFAWAPIILSIAAILAVVLYSSMLNKSLEWIAFRNAVVTHPTSSTDPTAQYSSDRAATRCEGQPAKSAPIRFDAFVVNFGSPARVIITCSVPAPKGSNDPAPVVNSSVEFLESSIIDSIRLRMPAASVPGEIWMHMFFFIAFTAASAAFVLTGLKDYLQKELGFTDRQLIQQQIAKNRSDTFDVEGVPNLYGRVDYTPGYPHLAAAYGPFCVWHHREPVLADADDMGRTVKWTHPPTDEQKPEITCKLQTKLTPSEIEKRFRTSWEAVVRGPAPDGAVTTGPGTVTTPPSVTP